MTNDNVILPLNDNARGRTPLLVLRLGTLVLLVVLMTIHLRSMRVFRWEQSVSGGVFVTYNICALGLALCAGVEQCGGHVLQAYLSVTGAILLTLNAAWLWRRWRSAGELTRVVAELLVALGVPLRRQVLTKVILSAIAAILLLLDFVLTPLLITT